MTARNPNTTARNKRVSAIKDERRLLQPKVFKELKTFDNGRINNEASLNAFIGGKIDDYIDLRSDVINTPMEFKAKWLNGLKKAYKESVSTGTEPRHQNMMMLLKGSNPNFRRYVDIFLEGSFLKHYEAFCKVKPEIEESEYWFGNNADEHGLLVTPRFANGKWENDGSEIRHFKHPYWTIAHVLNVGLCPLKSSSKVEFSTLKDYLQFFERTVRMTKSHFQLEIAKKYIEYVEKSDSPGSIPLLIPELRYDPHKIKHEYRLDFLIINPWTMSKIGFEFSPWSTHGQLTGKGKLLKDHNEEAKANFEREMRKHKSYWRKYGIIYVVYTDEDLSDMETIWKEIKKNLELPKKNEQLDLMLIDELLS